MSRLAWIVFAFRLVVLDGLEIARAHAMNDYASFHFAAFAVREGKNPYDPAVLDALAREFGVGGVHPYFYPPALAELLVPSSILDPWVARIVFWIVSTTAMAYAAWAIDRRLERDDARALFAVAVAVLWPIHDAALMGQVNAIVLALVVAWWTNRARGDRAAVFLGLAIAIKMSPALLVALPLARRRWRESAIALGVGGGAIALSCAVLGSRGLEFVREVVPGFLPGHAWHGLTVPIDLVGNHSVAAFCFALTRPHASPFRLEPGVAALQISVLAALFALWCARVRRTNDDAALGSLCVLMMIAPTYCYEHHLVFVVVIAAALARDATERGLPVALIIPFGVALAIVAAPVDALVVPATLAGKLEPWTRFPKLLPLLVAFVAPLVRRTATRAAVSSTPPDPISVVDARPALPNGHS